MIEQACRIEQLEVERIGLLLVQSDFKALLALDSSLCRHGMSGLPTLVVLEYSDFFGCSP
jgi:hypothetical protein